MLRRSSKWLLCLLLIISSLCGCDPTRTMDSERWLIELVERSGLLESSEDGNQAKQALREWGIQEQSLALEGSLKKEAAALILAEWLQQESINTLWIKDLNQCQHPEAVEMMVGLGLMKLDQQSRFNPNQYLKEEEALLLIDQFILLINQIPEEHFEIEFKPECRLFEQAPYAYDSVNQQAFIDPEWQVAVDDILFWQDEAGWHVEQIAEIEEGIAQLKSVELSNIEQLDIAEQLEVDWTQAEFLPAESVAPLVFQKKEEGQLNLIQLSASSNFKKEFEIQDFTVRINYTTTSFSIYAFKKTALDANFFVQLDIKNLKPAFQFKGSINKIDQAYFKVAMDTVVASGLKKGNYQRLSLNPNKIDSADLLKSINTAWTFSKAQIDTVIPLGEIRLPVEGIPSLILLLQVQLRLYANGRIELLYTMNSEVGMEVRNNRMRFIQDHQKDLDFIIRATCGIASKILVGIEFLQQRLLDASFSAGISGEVKSTLHFPEKKQTEQIEDIPYDLLEELVSKEGFTVCADLSAYWDVQLLLNSSKSLAGRLGLSKTVVLLNQTNGALFDGSVKHIENMQFVDRCTRKSRSNTPLPTIQANTDRILLASYAYAIKQQESTYLKIRGLPEGITLSELIFVSNDPSIATVDAQGKVSGVKAGSTTIIIKTVDHSYEVQCSILVKKS